jgi:hypothetical protein
MSDDSTTWRTPAACPERAPRPLYSQSLAPVTGSGTIRYLLAGTTLIALWWLWTPPPGPAPGALAPEPPQQSPPRANAPLQHAGYRLEPRADFSLRARVLARRQYRFDRGAALAPIDLALGWGDMSDSAVLDHIRITQHRRFYFWSARSLPIPRRAIETQSANMHLIPAAPDILAVLRRARPGDVVDLRGRLVDASHTDGWRWRTSLTRGDTGRGACELIYVTAARILDEAA